MPAQVGHLDALSCASTEFCAGLAADSEYLDVTPSDATFLATTDGGKTFTDLPIIAGDSMDSLTCPSSSDCTAVGWNDAVGEKDITAGMTAYVLMIPLALTSTRWSIRKLGGKRWQALHRLIYVSAAAGVIHYIWLVKADLKKPLEYASVLAALLLYRVIAWIGSRAPTSANAKPRES